MTESNPTQVILTDNGIKIIKAQNTAGSAASGVTNLNDPNKLAPAEKATLKRKYDTDVLLYGMDTKKLTDNHLSTSEIDSAMSALTAYMTPFFAKMSTTDTVDRDTLNTVYKNFDTADKNADSAFTNMVSSAASGAMVAGNQAKIAGSEAVVAGNQASEAASNASVQASVAVSNANVAQSSVVAAIAKAGFASDAASAASQAATSAALTASAAAAGVIDAKNDAANALTSAASALSKVNGMQFGGTNLLRDTGFSEDGHPYWQGPADLGVVDGYLNHNAVSFDETNLTGSNYIDFQQIIHDSTVQLIKFGEWYTLSFYAKGSGKFASFVYPLTIDVNAGAYVDGQFISPAQPDGNNFWTLTDDWVRHTYIFKVNQSIDDYEQRVLWRTYAGSQVAICMPQLEQGNVVSDYSQSSLDVQVQISDINDQLESKISQTDYNILAGRVTGTETVSAQNKSDILLKANQSDVKALEDTVTDQTAAIKVNANAINQKADSSTVNTLTGNVSALSGEIDTQSDQIKLMASKTDLTTATTGMATQSYVGAQIKLTSDAINQTVSDVQASIKNLGSPNLVPMAGWTTGSDGGGSPSLTDTHAFYTGDATLYRIVNSTTIENYSYSQRFALKRNTTYTFSFICFAASGVKNVDAMILARASGDTASYTKVINLIGGANPSPAEAQYFTSTFTTGAVDSGYLRIDNNGSTDGAAHAVYFTEVQIEEGKIATPYREAQSDFAQQTQVTAISQTANAVQVTAQANQTDITSLQATAKGLQASVSNAATKDQLNILSDTFSNEISSATSAANSKMIQTINNASIGFTNPDGSKFQMNLSADGTALMDFSKIMLNGATNIQDATIGTAQIADAAITNAKIGKLAVGTAQIADLAVTSAKVSEIDASLIKSGIIDTNRLNADAIIANVINGKTINGITINTPTLNLGANGTLTTSFNLNQPTSFYAPKKGTGTLKISTGVINSSSANMSRYSNTEGYWYGFDDNGNMVKNGTNPTVDDYAPGYEKHDIMKSTGTVLNRSYLDAMGLMFTEGGNTTYNTMLTGVGLETAAALLHKDLTTDGTFKAALGTDNKYGFSIGNHVIAPMIQANSVTYSANMFITSHGYMATSTSTKANKLDIVDVPNMLQKGYNLLTINPRQWFDKTSVEAYADAQSGNPDSIESVVDIKPVTGMVAEEVASAGLDDYVVKDENNKVQGLAYDRLWTLLLPVLRDMNDKINKLQKKEGI